MRDEVMRWYENHIAGIKESISAIKSGSTRSKNNESSMKSKFLNTITSETEEESEEFEHKTDIEILLEGIMSKHETLTTQTTKSSFIFEPSRPKSLNFTTPDVHEDAYLDEQNRDLL